MGDYSEIKCICSRCKSQFYWNETIVTKRKLYNTEVEEHECPKCGYKGISPLKDIHYLAGMASKHTHNGID
jgi:DNA-directed RNA polymerase subunit RPC12/RpoP